MIALRLAWLILLIASTVIISAAEAAENACGPEPTGSEQQAGAMAQRIRELESRPCVGREAILQRKAARIREIGDQVRQQRQTLEDFRSFFSWMANNLSGYNKYIQAGSYAAVIARALPIPYAGQASVFAKFAAQFTLALNNASLALANYTTTSAGFIDLCDRLGQQPSVNELQLAELTAFADQRLLKDMNEAHARLDTVAELASGTLSFLESVNHYVSGTDEYWNKFKGVFRKDVDPKEKSFVSESVAAMKGQASRFNSRLKTFDELSKKENTSVKSLAAYDEMLALLSSQQSTPVQPHK